MLLANGKVHEAFQYQRSQNKVLTSFLSGLFAKAEKLGKLDSILQLTLMSGEERALVEFLNEKDGSTGRPKSGGRQEILLMFYLQRSRFHEAVALSQKLEASGVGGDKAKATRQAIMSR